VAGEQGRRIISSQRKKFKVKKEKEYAKTFERSREKKRRKKQKNKGNERVIRSFAKKDQNA